MGTKQLAVNQMPRSVGRGDVEIAAHTDTRFRAGMAAVAQIDVNALQAELQNHVEGEVRFDEGTKAMYATDASNFRQVPIGVVIPKTIEDVVAAHAACAQVGAPILCRGAGTSLSGETVNVAVVIDFSKYLHKILEIDPVRRLVRVQPGAINEQVNIATGKYHLVFGPDPSTHSYCTIGGNVGNNSCGVHSVQARFEGEGGRTSDNVHELEILTYDGVRMRVGATDEVALQAILSRGGREAQIYGDLLALRNEYADLIRQRFHNIPRRVSGYNLDELLPEKGFNIARALAGTEGTCATVLEATLQLVPNPEHRTLLVVGYPDIYKCGDHISEIMDHRPIGCEGLDHRLITEQKEEGMNAEELQILPRGGGWLLVEFGGESKEEADDRARKLIAALEKHRDRPVSFKIIDDQNDEAKLWKVREGGLGATAFPPPNGEDHWPGWEDSAVPPEKIGSYLRELNKLYDKYHLIGALYGHIGDGCVHSRINFDLRTAKGLRDYRAFLEEAADLVTSYGGSLSGEHGDGQQRAELLEKQYGAEIVEAFRRFKSIWDPQWKMNPGKVVDPYRFDENLKLGTAYNPPRPAVKFSYANDHGDFAHATLRCVGVGKCRIPNGENVMCPSFMATREEKHTTRGRARMLFEMMQGDVITDGWRSKEVKDALDLCLACKGCTNDCPVNVDMPTYKAEFLHHHWKRRLRPRHAYAMGFIDKAARVASRMPNFVNAVAHAPGLANAIKFAGGITQEREMPAFATLPLQKWFQEREVVNPDGKRVVLWPDTFNNYFHAGVGMAAVEALEGAGYRVLMPQGHVCCGRPLYDYGFLNSARKYLERSLAVLRPYIRQGLPVVGLEPSCTAVFKDELRKMLPNDDDAKRLSQQVHHLGEFLQQEKVELPPLQGKALLWGHCHQKATGGLQADEQLLTQMGLEVQQVKGGCCGLAGSFGFESGHYDISMKCGDEALLPAVKKASPETVIVSNGFSCKTQIEHGTSRRGLHLAEVISAARKTATTAPPEGRIEKKAAVMEMELMGHRVGRSQSMPLLAGAALAAGATAWRLSKTRKRR